MYIWNIIKITLKSYNEYYKVYKPNNCIKLQKKLDKIILCIQLISAYIKKIKIKTQHTCFPTEY